MVLVGTYSVVSVKMEIEISDVGEVTVGIVSGPISACAVARGDI